MAYTQADLTNVEKAIIDLATNRRPVKFVIDGEVVEYSAVELPQLRALRNEIAAEVSAADPTSGASRSFVVYGGKGL
ncbi:MAG: hypothetical protein KJ630_17695 [Proteobacteria bacterium]|nr:hypothetical protein [Pseudomonadota bacterium]